MSSLHMYTRARLMSDGHARRFVCSRNFVLLTLRYVYEIILQGSQIHSTAREIYQFGIEAPRVMSRQSDILPHVLVSLQPVHPVRARRTRAVCVTPSKWILSSLVCSIIN